jgi:hypothetical protein
MTLSTRLNQSMATDVAAACKMTGVTPSDLAREGLARVLAEFKARKSVRFGAAKESTRIAPGATAARRRKPSTRRAAA